MRQAAPQLIITNAILEAVSPGGRYVMFMSDDSGLTSVADLNGASDVFVKDLQSGTTALISINATGTAAGNAGSFAGGGFSADDRYVLFTSVASNLVSNQDTNGAVDAFVRDLQTGTTTLVSVNTNGAAAGILDGSTPQISADGHYVAFVSDAMNLVPGLIDTNHFSDAFVRDLRAVTTKIVSLDTAGGQLGASGAVAISADGQRVAFGRSFIYLRDVPSSTTTVLSADYRNRPISACSGGNLSISGDGTVVVFTSSCTNLTRVPDFNGGPDIYVRHVPR